MIVRQNNTSHRTLLFFRRTLSVWCPLKSHTYLNKPAAVCLSMCDLLVDTRHLSDVRRLFQDPQNILHNILHKYSISLYY